MVVVEEEEEGGCVPKQIALDFWEREREREREREIKGREGGRNGRKMLSYTYSLAPSH